MWIPCVVPIPSSNWGREREGRAARSWDKALTQVCAATRIPLPVGGAARVFNQLSLPLLKPSPYPRCRKPSPLLPPLTPPPIPPLLRPFPSPPFLKGGQ